MLDGRILRIAPLLLLLPTTALAATPSTNLDTAYSVGGQEITDLAVDATGQFATTVVAYDATRAATGGLPLPTTGTRKYDIYPCDFGAVTAPRSGSGCRGLNHVNPTATANAAQSVDLVSIRSSGGLTASYAIAGPNRHVSFWELTSDAAKWSAQIESQSTATTLLATNVTLTADAQRLVLGVAPATGSAGSRIEVRQTSNGSVLWDWTLRDAAGAAVRPTSLDASRTNNVVAVGTSNGLILIDPTTPSAPGTSPGGISQAGSVNEVALTADGAYVALAGSNGVFLSKTARADGSRVTIENGTLFNRGFDTHAQGIALALDGSRFAAAAGSKVHFFQRLDTAAIAQPVGDAFDAGAPVADLAYDAKGQLLVVIAGNNVYGFGPGRNTPVWTFDATTAGYGGVDGPLKKVSVSDDGMRVVVAGKTKVMSYNSRLDVVATLTSTGNGTVAPASTIPLALNVRNTGSVPDNYTFVVITPIGWPSASAEGFRLDPDATGIARFNLTAPAGQAPGLYAVEVKVRSAAQTVLTGRNDIYLATPAFNITVPRSVVLSISAPDERLQLRQGGEESVPITLRNQGNAEGVVNMSVRQDLTRGASWDIRFQPEQVRVPPGGQATTTMLVTAPSDAGSGDRNIVTIRAREGDTIEANDNVTAYVDPQFSAEMRALNTSIELAGGESRSVSVTITNTGNTEDTYNITTTLTPAGAINDWSVRNDTPRLTIGRGQSRSLTLTVKAAVAEPELASLTVKAISQSSPDNEESTLVFTLVPKPKNPTEEEKNNLLPNLAPVALLGVLAMLAIARRRRMER